MSATAQATQLSQNKAVALLLAVGRKDAADFDLEKLVKALKKVPAKVESGDFSLPEDADDEVKETLELVKAAVEASEEITIKAGKVKVKGEKKAKGDRKPPTFVKDAYGCRVGSMSAKINEGLSSKPKTAEKLAELAGCDPKRAREHCRFWVKKTPEIFGITEDGSFFVKIEGEKPAKKKKKKDVE